MSALVRVHILNTFPPVPAKGVSLYFFIMRRGISVSGINASDPVFCLFRVTHKVPSSCRPILS